MWFLWRRLIVCGGLYGLAALSRWALLHGFYHVALLRQVEILQEFSHPYRNPPSEIRTDASSWGWETQIFSPPMHVGTGTDVTEIAKQKRGIVYRLELQPSSWLDATCEWTVTASCATHWLRRLMWHSSTQSCQDDGTLTPHHCTAWNKGTQQTVQIPRGSSRVVTVRCGGWSGWPRTLTSEGYRDGGFQPQMQSAHTSRGPPFAQTFEVHCAARTWKNWWLQHTVLFQSRGTHSITYY